MSTPLPAVDALSPDQRAIYDMLPLDLTRGLLLTRSSAAPYLALGRSFHDGRLPAPVREVVILRVGALTHAAYELHHHIPQARACGLTDDLIERVIAGDSAFDRPELDALMEFVDQLVGAVQGPPPDLTTVQTYYSLGEIAELTLLVGHYVMTALFINTLGIEPERQGNDV
ncbi:carboxymuconolactone decarboxylase family protein [Mycobacterium sp. CVI_P3]|uniref:Carboxymuconolactone decarboxylase family protein n=1 Tax=Mycobacterium pinniadriaticum TaxID=2994102 RepID=A0ABT3SGI1_9MYCO|nr:carboxymuconolactone decarboxylase family protein [Mycobacterium pinniadriaticum]MCX2931930.1 carboxymuconolactone decarboxylase family protein [Mycobacterium pinniadriaticum]MCX2938259.1 carboxymuconolactone decarboxylase family protein [Mycobacterium pinniadriaticum]